VAKCFVEYKLDEVQKEKKKMNRIIRCALLICVAGVAIPAAFAQDNASVTAQLDGTKPLVTQIKKDAATMQGYATAGGLSWQTHAATLDKIKGDVNKLQESMRGLQSHRTTASPWQQEAIDRITGLVNDLATNMNKTIDQLSKSKQRPTTAPYPEYLKENARLANAIGDEINGTIDAGEAKAKEDALQSQLPK
jgi:hypothetical protein